MKGSILMFFMVILSASCGSHRSVTEVPVKETLVETVELHDTTVQVELVPYHQERQTASDSSRLTNEYSYSFAYWDGQFLHHTLGIFPGAFVTFKVPDYKTYTVYSTKEVPVTVEVERKLSLWQQLKINVGGYAICLSLMFIVCLIYYIVKNKCLPFKLGQ